MSVVPLRELIDLKPLRHIMKIELKQVSQYKIMRVIGPDDFVNIKEPLINYRNALRELIRGSLTIEITPASMNRPIPDVTRKETFTGLAVVRWTVERGEASDDSPVYQSHFYNPLPVPISSLMIPQPLPHKPELLRRSDLPFHISGQG